MWQRQDGMKRGHGEQCGLALFHPLHLGARLARGTMAIATRVGRVALVSALDAALRMPAALGGTAGFKVAHDLLIRWRQGMGVPVRLPIWSEDVGHFPAG